MDGKLVPWADAKVHVLTHSLHYGVAVFEGIRCYPQPDGRGAIFRLREHVRRLFESAKICLMEMTFTKEQVFESCKQVMVANKMNEGYLRPIRSEEHTSELQSPCNLVCRLLLEKKK